MFDHASHDCISTFLLTEKMQVVSCDVTMVTISRGESQPSFTNCAHKDASI